MKVLHFIRRFNGITHTFIYNELMGLKKEGVEVKVACIIRENIEVYPFDNLEQLQFSILQRIWNNRLEKIGIRMKYTNTPLKKSIKKVVQNFKPDLIHCQFGPDAIYFLDNYQYDMRVPIFVSFHGFDASQMLTNKLYCDRLAKMFQIKNLIAIFPSAFLKNNVADIVDIPRYFILPYGTDTSFFTGERPPIPDTPFRFLQVSSFREKKGHEYTLQAFAKLIHNNPGISCELELTGNDERRAKIEDLCKKLKIEQFVKFSGFVNREQCKSLMQHAHAFVHHSITAKNGDTEGLPNAIIEAMAMKLPIISTYHSGIPELVEHQVNGFLVPEKAVEEYALYMKEIMSWPYLPQNRQKVLDKFSNEAHSRILIDLYQKALQERTIA